MIAYKPFYIALFQGQPTVIVFFILCIYLFYFVKGNIGVSGVISSLILLKLQYLTLLPFLFLLIKNKKKYLVALSVSISIYLLINIVLYGRSFLFDYSAFLKFTENFKYFSSPNYMLSVQAWLVQLFKINSFDFSILLISGLLYALFFVSMMFFGKKTYTTKTLFGVGIIFGLLFSLHFLTQDLLLIFIYIIFVSDWIYQNKFMFLFSKNELIFLLANLALFVLASIDNMSYVIFNSSVLTSSALLLSVLVIGVLYPISTYNLSMNHERH